MILLPEEFQLQAAVEIVPAKGAFLSHPQGETGFDHVAMMVDCIDCLSAELPKKVIKLAIHLG